MVLCALGFRAHIGHIILKGSFSCARSLLIPSFFIIDERMRRQVGAHGVSALKCVIKKPEAPVPIKATDPWRLVDERSRRQPSVHGCALQAYEAACAFGSRRSLGHLSVGRLEQRLA